MKLQKGVILWLDVVAHRASTRLTPQSPVVQHCNYFQKSSTK